jgi:hypothetical protein
MRMAKETDEEKYHRIAQEWFDLRQLGGLGLVQQSKRVKKFQSELWVGDTEHYRAVMRAYVPICHANGVRA